MKKFTTTFKTEIFLLLFFITVIAKNSMAQTTGYYNCYIKNITQTSTKTLEFDVWVEWTGSEPNTYKFNFFQAGIDFNYSGMLNGGTITGAFVSGSADASIPTVQQSPNWNINSTSHQIRMLAAINTTSSTAVTIPASPGIRLGTFRITNTADFTTGSTPDFTWKFATGSGTTTKTALGAYIGTSTLGTAVTTQTSSSSYSTSVSPQQHFLESNPALHSCTSPSLSASITNATCNGNTDGAIDLTTSGGTSPFTYSWTKTGDASFSASTEDISGLSAGTYNVTVTTLTGSCTATGSYTVTEPDALSTIITTADACDSYTWSVNSTTYTSSGTYNTTIGCQPYILNLTITGSTSDTTTASACDSYTWTANNTTYTSSGTYTYVNGCNTKVLNLTITGSTSDTTTASACDSYIWDANNTTYTSNGTYTYVNGCNTKVLNLTITGSTSDTTTASACDSYTWSANGTTYTASGVYEYVNGCNTKVLNLTITGSTSDTTTVSACGSYLWAVNGTLYAASGTYTHVNGCTTNVLQLTVTTRTNSVEVISACDSYTWSADGATYTSSGTYLYTNNCNVQMLILTITGSTSDTTTASACDSYTWDANNTTYTSSGTYTYVNGCNTKVLNLTITGSTSDTTTVAACSSYTWAVNSTTYTSSGYYSITEGCATHVLNLTISKSAAPEKPGSVSGQQFNLCNVSGNLTYSVTPVSGATSYTWIAPSGTTIVSGDGTNSIVLNISSAFAGGQRLYVSAVNACGTSAASTFQLQVKPAKPVISGSSCASANQANLTYTVTNPEEGVTYTWRVPGIAKIVSGQGTDTVTVDWRASSGTIMCTPSNTCAAGARASYAITVGCATAAIASGEENKITVYPNPTSGLTNILFTSDKEAKYKIVITDITGRTLMSKELMASAGWNKVSLDLAKYANGIYMVSFITGKEVRTVKIVRGD